MSDGQVIVRFRATRDKDLVGILFDRHAHLVFGICFRLLKDEERCKDAVLTIFGNLFEDLLQYEVRNFPAWIHSVARNHCLAELKRMNRECSIRIQSDIPSTETDEPSVRNTGRLKIALAAISREQQTCIELFYLDRLSYLEVAARTGMTYNQVKSHIQNGKRNLKRILTHAS